MKIEPNESVECNCESWPQSKAGTSTGEEALRDHLEAMVITDLDLARIAESQIALNGEFPDVPES